MSEQTTPSLLEQLQAHHQAGYLSLHMPGHKEYAALALTISTPLRAS